jgi:hypothetical protein
MNSEAFPISFHPETPLPSRERDGVRGSKTEHFEILNHYHPHPTLPPQGGGEKWSFRMETRLTLPRDSVQP